MAMNFNDVNGEAKKTKVDYFKFKDGKNSFRMIGEILPRYVYWKKTPDGSKNMSIECLGFDRELEKFTNITKDWFQHYFPEEKCSWSYLVQVIDPSDGKIKVLGLKKKLFGHIISMAKDHLGDPTDPENGWMVVVNRTKTGPLTFNVEYTLDQLSCKKHELDSEMLEKVAELKTMEELFPIQSPEEQKAFIEKIWFSKPEVEEEDASDDDMSHFDDDIPM